jgi:hypothetical protein
MRCFFCGHRGPMKGAGVAAMAERRVEVEPSLTTRKRGFSKTAPDAYTEAPTTVTTKPRLCPHHTNSRDVHPVHGGWISQLEQDAKPLLPRVWAPTYLSVNRRLNCRRSNSYGCKHDQNRMDPRTRRTRPRHPNTRSFASMQCPKANTPALGRRLARCTHGRREATPETGRRA